jgi:hypothetical protein
VDAGTRGEKLHLRGELRQLPFEGKKYKVYGTYKHENTGRLRVKQLSIDVPEIRVPPSGKLGLYAGFSNNSSGHHYSEVRIRRSYYHSAEAQKFFQESVQPVLESGLPAHMKRLISFDDRK